MVNYFLKSQDTNAIARIKQRSMATLLAMLFVAFSPITLATSSDELYTSVDRTQIYQNETVELTVIGQLELELNFSNLFNLRNLELPAPDLGSLTKDFEILDQQQKYNIQSVNGTNSATITWVYTLSPKRSGDLQLPIIKHNEKASKPISIKVLEGKATADDGRPPMVFMEAEVDKEEVYVQEQLVYTLRLYHADNLAGGDLSNPELDDAIVEQVGEQKKYYRMRYNQRYEVIERKFLMFPQKSGELTIAPQTFNGTIIDSRLRKRRHVRDSTEAVSINVRPPATAFTGQTWLPAISLNLSEKWDKPLENVSVGDSFTRTISIQALGLLGSALPPLNFSDVSGFKQYPDQPETESLEHQAGVESSRIESIAMVAVKEGKVTLPEIKIPWWDTINQVERVAIIPSRELTIGAGQSRSKTDLEQANISAPNKSESISNTTSPESTSESDTPQPVTENAPSDNTLLYAVIVFLIAGWGVTAFILLKRKNRPYTIEESQANTPESANELSAFNKLSKSIQQKSPSLLGDLVQWAKLKWPEATLNSVSDVERLIDDEALSVLISKVETSFYSSSVDRDSNNKWDNEALLKRLTKIRKKSNSLPNNALPGFYP